MSDHSGGEESNGNAEERDESGQQDNAQEVDKSSGDETCSETESSEVPAGEAAKGAIIEMDSEDSESSSDSQLRGDHALGSHTEEGGKGGQTQYSTLVLTAIPGPKTVRGAA